VKEHSRRACIQEVVSQSDHSGLTWGIETWYWATQHRLWLGHRLGTRTHRYVDTYTGSQCGVRVRPELLCCQTIDPNHVWAVRTCAGELCHWWMVLMRPLLPTGAKCSDYQPVITAQPHNQMTKSVCSMCRLRWDVINEAISDVWWWYPGDAVSGVCLCCVWETDSGYWKVLASLFLCLN